MQHPQRLHRPGLGLGDADPPAIQRCPGGVDRVQLVILAVAAPLAPVGPINLPHDDPGIDQVPADPGAVAAGAPRPDRCHLIGTQPAHQGPVAGPGGGETADGQHRLGGIDHRRHMHLLMGVDPPTTVVVVEAGLTSPVKFGILAMSLPPFRSD